MSVLVDKMCKFDGFWVTEEAMGKRFYKQFLTLFSDGTERIACFIASCKQLLQGYNLEQEMRILKNHVLIFFFDQLFLVTSFVPSWHQHDGTSLNFMSDLHLEYSSNGGDLGRS